MASFRNEEIGLLHHVAGDGEGVEFGDGFVDVVLAVFHRYRRVPGQEGVDAGVAVDVSGATTLEFTFTPPTKPKKVKTAVLVNDGKDGKIKYVTVANDLNEIGIWKIQAHVVFSNGEWRSDILSFNVFGNL